MKPRGRGLTKEGQGGGWTDGDVDAGAKSCQGGVQVPERSVCSPQESRDARSLRKTMKRPQQ